MKRKTDPALSLSPWACYCAAFGRSPFALVGRVHPAEGLMTEAQAHEVLRKIEQFRQKHPLRPAPFGLTFI